ncbi:hypothetical protein [Pseudomonas syringae]|uniref:hypothetical protein n=1 Tax=Pseudomonas syringae TaxID=317 RepID=UPI003F74DEE6
MASVGVSVRKALQDFDQGEFESAMMHACNAVDGTSKKAFPEMRKHGHRFTRLLRENYAILGPFGIPGINLHTTRWPVDVTSHVQDGLPDAADLIYGIHRCSHGHGDELPEGFELIRCANISGADSLISIEKGSVRLSDNVIFGLLAVAISSPLNLGQVSAEGCNLTYRGIRFMVNDLWGKHDELLATLSQFDLPVIHIDFAHMMNLNSDD